MTDVQKKTAGIAITSLVLGIVGLLTIWLCGLGVLCAIPAVICGHIGYARVKQSAGALAGRGLAMAGLIMGYLSIGLLVAIIPISLLAAIAVPSFVNARNKSIESSCKNNLRLLDGAMQQYALDNGNALAPGMTALVGTNAYIRETPVCKGGGVYTLPGRLSDGTTCSIHGSLRQPRTPPITGEVRPQPSAEVVNLTRARCENNLRLLDGAIQQYALDNGNRLVSGVTQLVGTNAYLLQTPCCPGGGFYTLPASLSDKTSCSLHGTLPDKAP